MALDASKLLITTVNQRKLYPNELNFGTTMTDHILLAEWDVQTGWSAPEIKPYTNFNLDPAASVFHYAFCCFEGQKAFLDANGNARIFRPEKNFERLNKSTSRIALPAIDIANATELLKKFVEVERDCIPRGRGKSLYLRPTVIGSSAGLGVSVPTKAIFYIIASPVEAFDSGGAVRLKATDEFTRAFPGGTGDCKLGANYAPCVVPQQIAAKEGFAQNLWLYDGNITEVGMMNFFLVFYNPETKKKEITTAPIDGLILEGITRMSVLELLRERIDKNEFEVTERPVNISELIERSKKNEVLEAFGTGTAAIVTAVKEINYRNEAIYIPTGEKLGEVACRILNWLQDIQYGVEEHPFCQCI